MTPARTTRIKVMRIIDRLNVGGPAIHAVLTTKGLDPDRFETVLVIGAVEPGEADMGYLLEQHGVTRVVCIPSLGRELRPFKDLSTLWELMKLVRKERPDVIHTHKAKAGAIGRAVGFICRVPARYHTFHGHVLRGYFGPTKSAAFTALERILALLSTIVVTVSTALADELAGTFKVAPRDKFRVVSLGFDLTSFNETENFRGLLRSELGIGTDTLLVGIVGRMVPIKDHATFVAAAALLAERRPDVQFVFVGGGELESQIHADAAARNIRDRCHFLGWRRDLPQIYADLDVVALSSINEGTPVSLIEAMAASVPVVSTDVGGVTDVLQAGKRGGLVPARDPAALATAIEQALTDEAQTRARQIQAEVTHQYGIGRLCADLADLYEEGLRGR